MKARRRKAFLGLARRPRPVRNSRFKGPDPPARWLAVFIATGIGLHNFSEGLAIGQSAAQDALSLAYVLVIGFALHNATEGFGICAPLSGDAEMPSWGFLGLLGLIGGGPTFIGTAIGQSWTSEAASVIFLALAGGSILYVVIELLNVLRGAGSKAMVTWGILLGLVLGFGTDFVLVAFANYRGRIVLASIYSARHRARVARPFTYEVPGTTLDVGSVVGFVSATRRRACRRERASTLRPERDDRADRTGRRDAAKPALVDLALWVADYYGSTPARAPARARTCSGSCAASANIRASATLARAYTSTSLCCARRFPWWSRESLGCHWTGRRK